MNRVLADISIWVEYFNRPKSEYAERLAEFLEIEVVYTTGIILTEFLQGAKAHAEFNLLRNNLKVLPSLKETERTWEKVAKLSFDLQRKRTIIPLTDCLIGVLF